MLDGRFVARNAEYQHNTVIAGLQHQSAYYL
ncbi:unnamed protein product [Linum tenue]|uniref:Uncharacterized protein n=1 Tax=Linum tenue TaxID=586396 RepID=A0AAV0LT52_9ROSI|nr:unnamed protein product [Linum tenue]